jgi:hypothetical protein
VRRGDTSPQQAGDSPKEQAIPATEALRVLVLQSQKRTALKSWIQNIKAKFPSDPWQIRTWGGGGGTFRSRQPSVVGASVQPASSLCLCSSMEVRALVHCILSCLELWLLMVNSTCLFLLLSLCITVSWSQASILSSCLLIKGEKAAVLQLYIKTSTCLNFFFVANNTVLHSG